LCFKEEGNSVGGSNSFSVNSSVLVCQIYSIDWAYQAEDRIVSASGDGRLIVWNALTSQKTHAIKLPCSWVMACAFSPSGRFVACGGLDNVCSIFDLDSAEDADGKRSVSRSLAGHKSYLSCCRYIPYQEANIITSSGDETCILWDAEKGQRVSVFGGENSSGHTAAVMRYLTYQLSGIRILGRQIFVCFLNA
jgi:guanine nucleotide-binding protein G(I)/G(S)/G(T) subunit beta-1